MGHLVELFGVKHFVQLLVPEKRLNEMKRKCENIEEQESELMRDNLTS